MDAERPAVEVAARIAETGWGIGGDVAPDRTGGRLRRRAAAAAAGA